jgi:hypothetical protein
MKHCPDVPPPKQIRQTVHCKHIATLTFGATKDMLGTSGNLTIGNNNVDPESVVMTETIILKLHCVKPCLKQCKLNTQLAETNLHSVGPARFERRQTQCRSVHGCFCRATQNSMCVHLDEEDLRTNRHFSLGPKNEEVSVTPKELGSDPLAQAMLTPLPTSLHRSRPCRRRDRRHRRPSPSRKIRTDGSYMCHCPT